MISIAIPYHGDRMKWTMQTINNVHNLHYVKDIVITIDPSDISPERLEKACKPFKKVTIYKNDSKLFVFRNKVKAVSLCTGEWVALIDSDNIIGAAYLGIFNRSGMNPNIIYQPSIGMTMLHYEEYIGKDINLRYAAENVHECKFNMLFNTMNYMFHRETWLNALKGAIEDDYDPLTADSAFINYHCLKAGMVMRVIYGMTYIHTVHEIKCHKDVQSTYRLYADDGVREYNKIINLLGEYKNENGSSPGSVYAERQNSISKTPNWSGYGRSSRDILSGSEETDKTQLLAD